MVRFKNRYLLVELLPFKDEHPQKKIKLDDERNGSELNSFSSSNVSTALRRSIEINFGSLGTALNTLALSVKYCNPNTRLLIIRCARDHEKMIRVALFFLGEWPSGEAKCIWVTRHVAGTMRSVSEAAIRVSRRRLMEIVETDPQKKKQIEEIVAKVEQQINKIEN